MTQKIGNITFNKFSMTSAQKRIAYLIEHAEHCNQVVVANAYSVVLAHQNKKFSEVCERSDIVFSDGHPIVWASILLGNRIPERIAGPDFMWTFSKICAENGYKIFLMGSEEPYLSRLKTNLEKTYSGINIVGTFSPPFGNWTDEINKKIVSAINHSKADLLWVGIGSPKQDIWIDTHKDQLNVKVAIGVGAAFDFHSGRIERAPLWMQKYGLEWFFRLTQDPLRLWKRYFVGNLVFIKIILIQTINHVVSKVRYKFKK
jgi:N-acetylglucosaminyldiphosphoundecaprenol N-acetyl-beta-D-mannosaminyltransferase